MTSGLVCLEQREDDEEAVGGGEGGQGPSLEGT